MEIADLILVNKADGDLKSTATRTVADYAGALRLLRKREGDPEGYPLAMAISAVEDRGLTEAWERMTALAEYRKSSGFWAARRSEQACRWFEDEVRQGLLRHLEANAQARAAMARARDEVAGAKRAPAAAAAEVLARLTGRED